MEKLKITCGGQEFYATLYTDKAPKTIAQLKEHSPIHTKMYAAKVCNEEVMCPAPFFYDANENPVFQEDPGNLCFYGAKHTFACFWGDVIPVAPCPNYGKVDAEYLEGFQNVCRTVWANPEQDITFEVVEM